jgi:hypothetical protein
MHDVFAAGGRRLILFALQIPIDGIERDLHTACVLENLDIPTNLIGC